MFFEKKEISKKFPTFSENFPHRQFFWSPRFFMMTVTKSADMSQYVLRIACNAYKHFCWCLATFLPILSKNWECNGNFFFFPKLVPKNQRFCSKRTQNLQILKVLPTSKILRAPLRCAIALKVCGYQVLTSTSLCESLSDFCGLFGSDKHFLLRNHGFPPKWGLWKNGKNSQKPSEKLR